ncbi:uncharacterized protein LOC129920969 [Episyrphus balteatus]|uniref:uncharacterized protein LOC129920969 n=1 Tax=Episyrphus balteatus TaxID=286459 RepID=UPI002484FA2E|nr:uncharacterized protein LOC129920969 [Episyrphus balteatus]
MADLDALSKATKRKRFHYAKYVNYDKERNISECLVCRKQLKSLSTGNIKRHYLKLHDRNLDSDADSRIRSFPLRKFCKFKPSMGMNKSEFLTCCVGLVAIRNIPISLFDDEDYFKKFLSPFEEEFKMTVNSKNIKVYLNGATSELRGVISDEIRAKLVCLKFEIVTRGERGFVVMNIQYIEEFKMVVQTIGVVEMVKNQEIEMQQILRNLNECGLDDSILYVSFSNICSNVYIPELHGEDNASNDLEWNGEYEKVHSTITDCIKCPSQTLHFVAKSVLGDLGDKIEKCRKNVISLLSMNKSDAKVQIPSLDISTRWLSTFYMIDGLSKLRTFIEGLEQPLDMDWLFINQFSGAFKPLAECLEKLHEVNYIIGDFYRDCLCCEIELEELVGNNIYAGLLLKELKTGKDKLLENGAFLAALYLDQRFNFIKTPFLTEEQQHFALDHLMTTVTNLRRPAIKDEYSSDDGEERSMDVTINNDPFVKLEERTKSMIGSQTPSKEGKTIKEKLDCLRFGERLSFHVDILNHWKCLTYEDFEMKQLVEAVLACPCTQSSMEMTMKEFANVLKNTDSNVLSNKSIGNILMTRLNSNILNFINLDVKNDDIGLV